MFFFIVLAPGQVFYMGSIYDVIHYNNNILLLQTFNWTQLNKSSPSQVFFMWVRYMMSYIIIIIYFYCRLLIGLN